MEVETYISNNVSIQVAKLFKDDLLHEHSQSIDGSTKMLAKQTHEQFKEITDVTQKLTGTRYGGVCINIDPTHETQYAHSIFCLSKSIAITLRKHGTTAWQKKVTVQPTPTAGREALCTVQVHITCDTPLVSVQ